tara:strand:- start:863 stop:1120 length:258 start_codon:yes stop_codon:yes gene_type:complete
MSKIKKKELETIVEQKRKADEIIGNLGMMETKKHELLHAFAQVNSELDDIKKDLESTYGAINVDLKTGEYTKAESKEEEPAMAKV